MHLSTLRTAATDSAAVATRADQLERLAGELQEQAERLLLFRARGLHPYIDPRTPARLLETTKSHRASFQQDRTSIAADPEDSGFKWRYRDELERLGRSLGRAVADEWGRYVDSLVPAVVEELLNIFERVPEFREEIAAIDRLKRQLDAARSEIPRSAADFERVESAARDLNERWRALSGVPEDVRAFLSAATNDRGASLDALSPGVRAWLQERGLLGSVRYVLRGGS